MCWERAECKDSSNTERLVHRCPNKVCTARGLALLRLAVRFVRQRSNHGARGAARRSGSACESRLRGQHCVPSCAHSLPGDLRSSKSSTERIELLSYDNKKLA